MIRVLYLLFVLSGAAGLIYESIWTRYLGLFVGHDAYAQIIVLVIFLGGMSAGAMAVSRVTERLKEPLYGYVAIEFAVGVIGLFFHDIFQATTTLAYQSLYPHLAGPWAVSVSKWVIAGALILPQSLLLGATFPLMSAGVLRLQGGQPGRSLSLLYFANSLGAAAGVLIAGFYLVELAGLPGTLLAAAMLNLLVAMLTNVMIVKARNTAPEEPAAAAAAAAPRARVSEGSVGGLDAAALRRLLLCTSFGTAVASFIYEIDWIRMLSLTLGSATHSFELMLSAFILGLALGAFWIRSRADRLTNPVWTLGLVQLVMGVLALATLPLYVASFQWIAALIGTFARTDLGYAGFTVARYAVCLVIMLPATFCAGMTLPLITRTLFAGGAGERAIGAVYGWNTLGSIVGVIVGGLVLLPLIGLKAMLIAGAATDIAIGGALLWRARVGQGRRRMALYGMAAAVAVFVAAVAAGTRLDQSLLVSGVYRSGMLMPPNVRDVRFYRDGRTATVSVTQARQTQQISLATNGKPDASLEPAWFQPCDAVPRRQPLLTDEATQTLLPLITLAHAPGTRTAAVIGQGSGMSSHLLLGSTTLERLVTIEIEPQMVAGSRAFYPANRRAFDDPRSARVIDDAKSYFASAQRRYDLILSEPSNPWVSGVSGLFTTEFYARVRQYLTDDGVFGQWLHTYELDDELVLSVLAALHQNFRSYEIYLVPSGDLLVVASNRPSLPAPDWSVMSLPAVQADLCRFIPFTPEVLSALHLVGRAALAPLLDRYSRPNSDYYPVLDLGAERRRYRRDTAEGFTGLSANWFNVLASLEGRRTTPGAEPFSAFPTNPRARARAIGAWLRLPQSRAGMDTTLARSAQQAAFSWGAWQTWVATDRPPSDWNIWLQQTAALDVYRNSGTAGVADEEFYRATDRFLDRQHAPAAVRDVVAFRRGVATWNFADAARTADRLLPLVLARQPWISADELRDGTVLAKLHLRDAGGAREYLDTLAMLSTRKSGDVRSQLLESYVTMAERARTTALRR